MEIEAGTDSEDEFRSWINYRRCTVGKSKVTAYMLVIHLMLGTRGCEKLVPRGTFPVASQYARLEWSMSGEGGRDRGPSSGALGQSLRRKTIRSARSMADSQA